MPRRWIALACLTYAVPANLVLAQPVSAAPAGVVSQRTSQAMMAGAPRRLYVARDLAMADASGHRRLRRRWYWYTLGGTVVGAGVTGALILASCDAGCRDDGAIGAPVFVAFGAGAGAVVGTVVGLLADRSRSRRGR